MDERARDPDIDEELRRALDVVFGHALVGDTGPVRLEPDSDRFHAVRLEVAQRLANADFASRLLKNDLKQLMRYIDRNNSKSDRLVIYNLLDKVLTTSSVITMVLGYKGPDEAVSFWTMAAQRSIRTGKAAERRSKMRPFVEDVRRKSPDASAASLATVLRRKPEFKALFGGTTRRTIETDVRAIMNPKEDDNEVVFDDDRPHPDPWKNWRR